jgi:hypothetical protein
MQPNIFMDGDDFERTEFSDEIHGILGRALIIATRFDSLCKSLAMLPNLSFAILMPNILMPNNTLNEEQYEKMISKIIKDNSNLFNSIRRLGVNTELENILNNARKARNEIAHSLALGLEGDIEYRGSRNIDNFILETSELLRIIAKGDLVISALISYSNKEQTPILDEKFCTSYENEIVNWVINIHNRSATE